MVDGRVTGLYRFPVKGMTPEALETISVNAGATFPCDRIYAIENGQGRFDPAAPQHLPKINFMMLMRDERLAGIQAHFDEADHTLTLSRDGAVCVRGQLTTGAGRKALEDWLAADFEGRLRGRPHIVSAPGHSFSDVAARCVHIVNLASVRDLEQTLGRSIDPLRFRANIYLDGLPAWAEFGWLDKPVRIGTTVVRVWDRTQRCAAVNVDPQSARRDMHLPDTLMRTHGHSDFGVYARIEEDGVLRVGDAVNPPG